MNKKFYLLDEKRQMEIINAGFEIFGKYEYKKASTELIAQRAGISKGLLFFYFKNKLEFYKFLYQYAAEQMSGQVGTLLNKRNDDFFEMIEIITRQKCRVLESMPYIFAFMIATVNSSDETVREALSDFLKEDQVSMTQDWLSHVDFSKFKAGIKPEEILDMLGLLLEGYIQQQLKNELPISLEQIMTKHMMWAKLLRDASYKSDEFEKGETI